MNYDDFVTRFGEPLQNEDGTILFETYAQDYKLVRAADPKCVWTLVEEDGKLYLAPGFHFVNRLNYVIAPIPRENEDEPIWFPYGDD